MKRKLNKLSAAVAAALAVGAVGQAQATDVLFPSIVVSDVVATIVTVLNPATAAPGTDDGEEQPFLHYRMWYKSGANATNNLAACEEVNVYLPTSPNDIQTIDLGAKTENVLGVMFNDPSVNNQWQQFGQSYALADGLPQLRGYLVVDDNDEQSGAAGPSGISLAGEAFIFEFQSGAAWGYEGGVGESGPGDANAADFRNPDLGVAFNAAGSAAGASAVSVMPWNEAYTYFFVTPLVANMRNGNNALGPLEVRARITFGAAGATAMWDRDENPISGNVNQEVRCTGRVTADSMISEAAKIRLPNGGWGIVRGSGRIINPTLGNVSDSSVGLSVIKLEFNDGSKAFAGTSPGVFNNAFLLYDQGL